MRRILPLVIAGSLFLAVDAVLWYFAVADTHDRTALIGAASAWGVAVLGILVVWVRDVMGKIEESKDEIEKSKKERRIAYKRLLSSADDFVVAQSSFSDAHAANSDAESKLNAAQEELALHPSGEAHDAVLAAEAELDVTVKSLASATSAAEEKFEEYQAVAESVDGLAPPSIRGTLEEFTKSLRRDKAARDNARANFVRAACNDLKLPYKDDESSL